MGLNILSKKLDSSRKVFNNIILAVLDAHLYCGINDSVQKGDGAIKDIDVRRYFGNKEDEYEYFLIDIPETEWSMKVFEDKTFKKDEQSYYLLAGTDNVPSKLSYDFSLAYLRLCPRHLISIYDHVFSLSDIEDIEKRGTYNDKWYHRFKKLDEY